MCACMCACVCVWGGMHKLMCLSAHVLVRVCVRMCGSPRGLPQAYHTQAVRDELPERERERERERAAECGDRTRKNTR